MPKKKKPTAHERGLNTFFDYWDQTTNIPADGTFSSTVAYIDKLAKVVLADDSKDKDIRAIAKRCRQLAKKAKASLDQQVAFNLGTWAQRLEFRIGPEDEILRAYRNSYVGAREGALKKHKGERFIKADRNESIKSRARELLLKNRSDVLNVLVREFGPDSVEDPDATGKATQKLKPRSLAEFIRQVKRELKAERERTL